MASAPVHLPKKQLTSVKLMTLQHDYENTGLTLRKLGRRFNVSHTLVAYHVKLRGWQRRMQKISLAVTEQLVAERMEQQDACATSAEPLPADPPALAGHETEQPRPYEQAKLNADRQPARPLSGRVVTFPRGEPARKAGQRQTPEEQLQTQVTMAVIRAIATVEQRDAIKRHEATLAKLGSVFQSYLDPVAVVATLPGASALSDKQRAAACEQVQATALAIIAPTKKDSFARTLQAFSRSFAELKRLEREVLGLGKTEPKAVLPDLHREARQAMLAALPLDDLAAAHRVMKALEPAEPSPIWMPPT